jgi:hypothetical protein
LSELIENIEFGGWILSNKGSFDNKKKKTNKEETPSSNGVV